MSSTKKKAPILAENPLEKMIKPQESPTVTEKIPEIIKAPELQSPHKVDYITLFDDYAVPNMRKVPKSRRVQLQFYPEVYQKAQKMAAELDISINDLIAAALEKMYKDYSNQKNG